MQYRCKEKIHTSITCSCRIILSLITTGFEFIKKTVVKENSCQDKNDDFLLGFMSGFKYYYRLWTKRSDIRYVIILILSIYLKALWSFSNILNLNLLRSHCYFRNLC